MTESNLVQLKIIVERAVRPVRASVTCKRKMREELLAHVSGAFEDELARVQDEHAALERTRVRFGNPTEMVNELQDSVRISDPRVAVLGRSARRVRVTVRPALHLDAGRHRAAHFWRGAHRFGLGPCVVVRRTDRGLFPTGVRAAGFCRAHAFLLRNGEGAA